MAKQVQRGIKITERTYNLNINKILKSIKISSIDFRILQGLISPLALSQVAVSVNVNNYIIEVSKETLELILDELGDIIAVKGFDSNYEPNGLGLEIEHLIDIISPFFYE